MIKQSSLLKSADFKCCFLYDFVGIFVSYHYYHVTKMEWMNKSVVSDYLELIRLEIFPLKILGK